MKAHTLNLTLAWLWILLGFLAGMLLGFYFHREDWWGGYGSLKRRMYRLAHISFFGLGTVNLLFWLTVQTLHCDGPLVGAAAWAFMVGAVTMPLCCVMLAHQPKATMLFAVPVVSLLLGGGLTIITLLTQPAETPVVATASAPNNPSPDSDVGIERMNLQPLIPNTARFHHKSSPPPF